MNSEVGLNEISRAIFNGIRAYKAEIEKNYAQFLNNYQD
jgi:hypothetical protein